MHLIAIDEHCNAESIHCDHVSYVDFQSGNRSEKPSCSIDIKKNLYSAKIIAIESSVIIAGVCSTVDDRRFLEPEYR